MLKKFYLTARESALAEKTACLRRAHWLVIARGATFVLAVLALAGGYDGNAAAGTLGAALLFVFARLVMRYRRAVRQLLLLEARLAVLEGVLARLDGRWRTLPEDGAERRAGAGAQLVDLQVFGPSSLYQYLCRARTRAGRDRLAAAFRTEAPAGAARALIAARHAAIEELLRHPRLALSLESYGALLPEGQDLSPLLAALAREPERLSRPRLAASLLLPALNVLALAAAGCGAVPWLVPGALIGGSFLLTWGTERASEEALALLMPLAQALGAYREIFRTLERASFVSPHLVALQRVLREGAAAPEDRREEAPVQGNASGAALARQAGASCRTASESLRHLARLAAAVSWRRNFFFYVLANGLFLFDFAAGLLFRRWCRQEGARLAAELAVWHEWEVLLSLSTLAAAREQTVFPTFLEGAPRLTATALQNPLLPEETAVPNDAALTAGTTILTGSNMSGKTTWLRTIGMNVLLAWTGAPVCAASFSLSPLALYTSIRVDDSLAAGMSTFYAELLRIKEMVEAEKTGRPLLLLIDEIFKGTNSADRITGARAALRHLTNDRSITLVSTHDFELCDLTVPGAAIENAHFEEHYEDGKIAFDYRLRAGRCRTTNAVYLLRLVGIVDEEPT